MEFTTLEYSQLSRDDLYDILKLRADVFVVEQNCAYSDLDNIDKKCIHIIGRKNEKLIAYARIIPRQLTNAEHLTIGRIVVHPDSRMAGIGKDLVQYCLRYCEINFPHIPIHIMAQNYLEEFYSQLGFQPIGNYFLEDNIPHQDMLYSSDQK